jgi:hypothetical protein
MIPFINTWWSQYFFLSISWSEKEEKRKVFLFTLSRTLAQRVFFDNWQTTGSRTMWQRSLRLASRWTKCHYFSYCRFTLPWESEWERQKAFSCYFSLSLSHSEVENFSTLRARMSFDCWTTRPLLPESEWDRKYVEWEFWL